MGSPSPRADGPHAAVPPVTTRSAALPYLSLTVSLMSSVIAVSSAARGEQAHQLRDHLGPGRVVHEALLLATLNEAGPAQAIEVMRQGRAGNLELGLDLAGRDLALGPDQEEEDLEPGPAGQRLERVGVGVASLEPGQRERLHISSI